MIILAWLSICISCVASVFCCVHRMSSLVRISGCGSQVDVCQLFACQRHTFPRYVPLVLRGVRHMV